MTFDYLSHFKKHNNFTYPDWTTIEDTLPKNLAPDEEDILWNAIFDSWSNSLKVDLGEKYHIYDSKNFKIISNRNIEYLSQYSAFLERCLSTILSKLAHISYKYENEPLLILIIEDRDDYYRYISHFYPDGEFGLSGGLFYRKGIGHFIFPHVDTFSAELVSAHELTHALVSHLDIPLWLNEGIATNMEDSITMSNPLDTSREIRTKHAKFWNEKRIQEFWSGESFSRTDDGQELSYNLAQLIVAQLAKSYNAFANFCNEADYKDAGEKAMIDNFGISLADLIVPLLGEKNWKPKPEDWEEFSEDILASKL